MRHFALMSLSFPLLGFTTVLTACGELPSTEMLSEDTETASLQEALLSDVLRIESRSDGLFDVYCKDGRIERAVTKEKILAEQICNPPPVVSAPFDPAFCSGNTMTAGEAVKRFAPAATEANLVRYQIAARTRNCTPLTGCGSWTVGRTTFTGPNKTGTDTPMSTGMLTLRLSSDGRSVLLRINSDSPTSDIVFDSGSLPTSATTGTLSFRYGPSYIEVAKQRLDLFDGRLTDKCFQGLIKRSYTSGPTTQEAEVALYSTF